MTLLLPFAFAGVLGVSAPVQASPPPPITITLVRWPYT